VTGSHGTKNELVEGVIEVERTKAIANLESVLEKEWISKTFLRLVCVKPILLITRKFGYVYQNYF